MKIRRVIPHKGKEIILTADNVYIALPNSPSFFKAKRFNSEAKAKFYITQFLQQ